MKIADKITQAIAKGETVFSYEYFPPRTEEGVENMMDRLERMAAYGPVFCDITWGAGGSTADVTLDIAKRMQNQVCVETMMHLTCTNMQVEKLEQALAEVRAAGLQNILALRGDPPKGQDKFEAVEGGFSCALDLVKYIRKTHGDYFGICVAGYPEAHPDTIVDDPVQMDKNYWDNIRYLKEKVDAGGDMIITQLFYDVDIFLKFVQDCKSVGITVPIVPGIMPIMTYGGFKRMTAFCKTKVPQDILDAVESIKDNEEAVRAYGIDLGVQMCKRLLDAGVPGLHMYSLNTDKSVMGILGKLGIIDTSVVPKRLPWSFIPAGTGRVVEGVRPVFWQHRPRSYMARTQAWTNFPAARWSEVSGQSLGEAATTSLTRYSGSEARKTKAVSQWGEAVASAKEVADVFAKYHKGDVSCLPWCESESSKCSTSLTTQAADLADKGLLVIAAQPAVNAAHSSDAAHGWGPKGGYVYQKSYVEFFASPEAYAALQPKLKAAASLSYIAAKATGPVDTNMAEGSANAISWGCFPGQEVVQPVVADTSSFSAWRSEAFALWTSDWAACYEAGSASRAVLQDIADSWYLVSVADNDYVDGTLFKVLTA